MGGKIESKMREIMMWKPGKYQQLRTNSRSYVEDAENKSVWDTEVAVAWGKSSVQTLYMLKGRILRKDH